MRCYLMRDGRIAAVEDSPFSLMKRRLQKLMRCFQSASTFLKASSCGIARACLSGIPSPLPQTTSPSGRFIGP